MRRILSTLLLSILISAPLYAQQTNSLEGKIWSVSASDFIPFPKMLKAIRDKRYIVMGERHGRHAHQGREAFLIGALAEAGRYPAIAFEMLSGPQAQIVSTYRATSPEYALGLGIALDWASTNWPSWSYYVPVFDAAFSTKAEIIGADLSDKEQSELVVKPIPEALRGTQGFTYYKDQMTRAHCGLIAPERAELLAGLQLARDAQMANAILSRTEDDQGVLLVVGASHVRKSTGIPSRLPNGTVAVVLLREATDGEDSIEDIVPGALTDFDYIWFTPKAEDTSFCDRIGKAEKK
tara:strand:+ start:14421 stop:15302 length:882 start_codon:yes stop_codon:yes gene_type:complete